MFLSMWTNYFGDLTLDNALREIAGAEFKYAELASLDYFIKDGNPASKISEINALCDKLGIKLYQLHGHFGTYVEKDAGAWNERFDLCRREIEISSALGIKIIVSHPLCLEKVGEPPFKKTSIDYYQYFMNNNISFYKKLIPHLERYGVKIAIENMCPIYNCFYSAEELLEIIDALNSEFFGICMDTSHLQAANQNIARFILKAEKKLIATHMSDNLGGKFRDMHLMPLFADEGDGWIDWFSVRDSLEKIGYQGGFNLEIPREGAAFTPLAIRKKKIKFANEYLSEFLEHKF